MTVPYVVNDTQDGANYAAAANPKPSHQFVCEVLKHQTCGASLIINFAHDAYHNDAYVLEQM